MLTRWIVALATFVIVILIGMVTIGDFGTGIDTGNFFDTEGANSFALIGAIALVVAFMAYAGVEYAQTGGFASIASQFDTRTIVLMPIAIAINIILGATVANALKLPIYLDSIGTILVGALAGPVAGALTGFLSNTLWTYVIPPPFQNGPAAAFGIVAVVIGVLAGLAGRAGWLRPRPNRSSGELAVGVRRGILTDPAYAQAYRKAWTALARYVDARGNLTQVCVGTGQSRDVAYYLARPTVTGDLHGQAALLWFAAELVAADGG